VTEPVVPAPPRPAASAPHRNAASAPHRDAALARAEVAARTGYGRLLALLAAGTHDLAGAEDALADALERALRVWPVEGVPDRPEAWLLTVARNRQRDAWRSAETRRTTALDTDAHAPVHLDEVDPDAVPDRRLELMLVCAHPAIAPGDRTPLMLNTVLGFTAEEVGRSYAVPARTMATRLVRAKRRVRDNRIPFRLPDRSHVRARMDAVLAAVYAAYVIEWSTGPGERDLPPEALHLAEVLAELVPDDPEVRGLAALVELSLARRPARTAEDGAFVPLADQDPARWDAALIDRAHEHLRAAHAGRVVGRYQLEAAVQAVHCARRATGTTDWATLLELHRSLAAVAPSLGSATALAAVTAEVDGPSAGLALLDADAARTVRFQPAWATRAELLMRLGRGAEAVEAYDRAVALTHDPGQRRHLEGRRDAARP
jgi:RNA polymerase sigma-70 factor (ECF subfamily)